MKVLALVIACFAVTLAEQTCYQGVEHECRQTTPTTSLLMCSATYGQFKENHIVTNELKAFALLNLERSYHYLLSSSYFNNYQTNRAGFSKLFRKLSDDAWEKTIDLVKHITKRGGKMDFSARTTMKGEKQINYTVEVGYEVGALAKALDTQKQLAERAFYIHREVTKNSHLIHDAEITQYIEEEFVEKQADTIRELAGYTSDLQKFMPVKKDDDLSLAVYLFDEYLKKVV